PNGIAVRTTRYPDAAVASGDTAMAAPAAPTAPAAGSGTAESSEPATTAAAAPTTPGAPAQGGRQDANEILRRVEQTAAGIRTLDADFTQSLRVPLLHTSQTRNGKLYQRKP